MSEQETGDLVATDILLAAYAKDRPALVQYLWRRLRCAATAEDLVQDVWLKLASVRAPVRNPRSFLFEIASNLAHDHGRSTRRHAASLEQAQVLLFEEDTHLTPERRLIAVDQLARAEAAIAALPERTRLIFRLNRFEGLSQRDIAERLGISTVAVEKHIRKMLAALAQAVKDENAGPNSTPKSSPQVRQRWPNAS